MVLNQFKFYITGDRIHQVVKKYSEHLGFSIFKIHYSKRHGAMNPSKNTPHHY